MFRKQKEDDTVSDAVSVRVKKDELLHLQALFSSSSDEKLSKYKLIQCAIQHTLKCDNPLSGISGISSNGNEISIKKHSNILSVKEAAAMFDVTTKTIRNWIHDKKIVALRPGREFLVLKDSLEKLLEPTVVYFD